MLARQTTAQDLKNQATPTEIRAMFYRNNDPVEETYTQGNLTDGQWATFVAIAQMPGFRYFHTSPSEILHEPMQTPYRIKFRNGDDLHRLDLDIDGIGRDGKTKSALVAPEDLLTRVKAGLRQTYAGTAIDAVSAVTELPQGYESCGGGSANGYRYELFSKGRSKKMLVKVTGTDIRESWFDATDK